MAFLPCHCVVGGAGHVLVAQRDPRGDHGLDERAAGAGDEVGLAGPDDEIARLAFLRDPHRALARLDARAAGVVEGRRTARLRGRGRGLRVSGSWLSPCWMRFGNAQCLAGRRQYREEGLAPQTKCANALHEPCACIRRHRPLPPLDLVRGFEAAARRLSFTQAAAELFVTQSAVSRQVQALEEFLGVKLFERRHKALSLTEAGQAYFRSVARRAGGAARRHAAAARDDARARAHGHHDDIVRLDLAGAAPGALPPGAPGHRRAHRRHARGARHGARGHRRGHSRHPLGTRARRGGAAGRRAHVPRREPGLPEGGEGAPRQARGPRAGT